ncbi:MAG: diguanylate cyclase [Synergistota bacterium]|nr:diguanylate cyclase [Synergistota bacterium]
MIADDLFDHDDELLDQIDFRERYLSLFPIPLFVKDRNSVYVFVNQAFADFLALPAEQIVGKGPFDLYPHEFAQSILDQDRMVMENAAPSTDLECLFKNGMGELVWLRSYKGPIFNKKNEVVGMVGGDMDITASKRTEEELRRSEERWKFAVDGAGDGICEWNIDTGEVFYSKQWKAMLGFEENEISPSLHELEKRIHSDDRDGMKRKMEEHLLGKSTSFSHEYRMVTKKGGLIWVLNRSKVFEWDEDGTPLRLVGIFTDITRRKNAEEMILHQATHDMLTGLPNRMLFNEKLFAAMADGESLGLRAAVIFMDLDNFKEINDSLGHLMGDLVLMAVAERLDGEIREIDTLARLGGDEFAFILPHLKEKEEAAAMADSFLESLRKEIKIDGKSLFITGSMGISFYPDDGEDVQTIMKHADIAMYRAKREGRDAWRFRN